MQLGEYYALDYMFKNLHSLFDSSLTMNSTYSSLNDILSIIDMRLIREGDSIYVKEDTIDTLE